jgi:MFS family permease
MTSSATANVPLWTKSYTLTVLTTVFIFIPWALFMPVLPVYVLEEIHGSPAAAGAADGVFLIAMALFRAQTDRFERMFGKRAVLFAGGILFACLNMLYLMAGTTRTVLFICFLSGACFAVVNTSLMALAAEITPFTRKGEGLGYVSTAVTVASAIGPFTGLLLAKGYGFGWVFIFCGLIALVGSFIALGIEIPGKVSDKPAMVPGFALRARSSRHGQFPPHA